VPERHVITGEDVPLHVPSSDCSRSCTENVTPIRRDAEHGAWPLQLRRSSFATGAAWRGSPFAVRNFRLLSVGQFTSTTGDYCYAVALPWLVLSNNGGALVLRPLFGVFRVSPAAFFSVGRVVAPP